MAQHLGYMRFDEWIVRVNQPPLHDPLYGGRRHNHETPRGVPSTPPLQDLYNGQVTHNNPNGKPTHNTKHYAQKT